MGKRVKEKVVEIKYSKLTNNKWYVTVFADAKMDFTLTYIIYLNDSYQTGKSSKCNLIPLNCHKAKMVVISTFDAEAMVLNDGIQPSIMIKHYIMEIMNWKQDLIKVD